MQGEKWANNKSKMVYVVLGIVRDCTNATNGRHMVRYHAEKNRDEEFVREITEWRQKFTKQG